MKKIIYFDNLSTTSIYKSVKKLIKKELKEFIGDANNTNHLGVKARSKIEQSRITIANLLHTLPANIRFTTNRTESNNLVCNYIGKENTSAIITSKYEHESVLKTLKHKAQTLNLPLLFVKHDDETGVDLSNLKTLLEQNNNVFVSLAHVNQFTGRLLQISRISKICTKHNAIFHCDMSLTMGKLDINLDNLNIDFITASAEKFGGINGAGLLFIKKGIKTQPLFFGNKNEYGIKPGTDNILAITAMAKALEVSYSNNEQSKKHFIELKKHLYKKLKTSDLKFESHSFSNEHFASYITTLSFEQIADFEAFMIKLDLNNIFVGEIDSSVIDDNKNIIISFNPQNTKKEIDKLVKVIEEI